ncbi:hypothetical protein MBLNU457_4567t1 [Dothideomycetes sp. NU457]
MSKRKLRTEDLALNVHAAADRHPPTTKRKRVDIIKSTNRIPFCDFITQHVPEDNLHYTARSTDQDGHTFSLEVKTVPYSTMPTTAPNQNMTAQELDACFDLIHSTSHSAYSQSSIGWHPRRKKREMREAEMRYLLVLGHRRQSHLRASAEAKDKNNQEPHAAATGESVSSDKDPAPKPAGIPTDAPPPTTPRDLRATTTATAVDPATESDKATSSPRCSGKLSSSTLSALTLTRDGKRVLQETELERLNALQKVSPADEADRLFATQDDEIDGGAANGTLPTVIGAASRCKNSVEGDGVDSYDVGYAGKETKLRHKNDETQTTCPARDDKSDTTAPASSNTSQTASEIIGFASFMLTHAPPEPVIYLYELHLQPTYRAMGLGAHLLSTIEDIGRSVGVQRAMLTVFKSNTDARAWYARKGWDVDSTSPADVELRRGSRECDYEIRSKVL